MMKIKGNQIDILGMKKQPPHIYPLQNIVLFFKASQIGYLTKSSCGDDRLEHLQDSVP